MIALRASASEDAKKKKKKKKKYFAFSNTTSFTLPTHFTTYLTSQVLILHTT